LTHLQAKFGFTPEAIYNTAKELAGKK
jgi:hypothetical protein